MVDQVEYTTRVVGVTFEGRQRVVAQLAYGESLRLRREPHNVHDQNAIRVERVNGEQVGYISHELAAQIAAIVDGIGGEVRAIVTQVTGGDIGYNYGAAISFCLPRTSISAYHASPPTLTTPSRQSGVASGQQLLSTTPYTFAAGKSARTLGELINLCLMGWSTAAAQFARGAITDWLENAVAELREQGYYDSADQYELAAISAHLVLGKLESRDAESAVEQNFALEEWLRTLPDYHPDPQLQVIPQEIAIPRQKGGYRTHVELEIRNTGVGLLAGSLHSDDPWIEIVDPEFVCISDQPCRHHVTVTTPHDQDGDGRISISSTSNSLDIRVVAPLEHRDPRIIPQVPAIKPTRTRVVTGMSPARVRLAAEHYRLGIEYRKRGQLDEAIQEYQQALQLKPDYAEAYNNLGWIYKLQGRLDEAIQAFQAAIRIDYEYLRALVNLGWAFAEKGLYDRAMNVLEAALAVDPGEASAHFALGWVHERQGRLDKAIQAYQGALRLDDSLDEAHLHLGWVYRQKSLPDKAMEEYQAAVRVNPRNAEAHYWLGLEYRDRGRTDQARRELEAALRLGYQPAGEILRTM